MPGAPELFTDHYLFLDWNTTDTAFTQQIIPDDSYFWFNLNNHSNFAAGGYTFEVNPVFGAPLVKTFQFPGPLTPPVVASSNIEATWLRPGGNLQITWPSTPGVDQFRISLSADNTAESISARVPGGTNSVVISRSAIDWLDGKSVSGVNVLRLSFQSRDYLDGNNVARHYSISQNVAKLFCSYESGLNEVLDEPMVFNSYTEFEEVVADCGGANPTVAADIEGTTWVETWVEFGNTFAETMIFNSDGSFIQTETINGVPVDSLSGTWTVSNDRVFVSQSSVFQAVLAFTPGGIKAYDEWSSYSSNPDLLTLDGVQEGGIWTNSSVKTGG